MVDYVEVYYISVIRFLRFYNLFLEIFQRGGRFITLDLTSISALWDSFVKSWILAARL